MHTEQFFCQNVFMEWNKAVTRDRSDKPHHVQAQLSFKKTCVKCHIFMSVSLKIEELNTTLCIVYYSLRGREVSDYRTKNGHFNVRYEISDCVVYYLDSDLDINLIPNAGKYLCNGNTNVMLYYSINV